MPFKTISAAKKHLDLGSEVRAVAYLSNPGFVAMLSTAPVRLALVPTSGTGGKVTNVSLDGAEGCALLSRDVAVVRASDESVWALLDITHTPKMEQVARDVRSLCMRPTGENALALGWDGSASQLTINRHDVEARSFSVRGTLRACDLTESEAYTVVDGADGGQLRVHPGATPEAAAILRANLPSQVASYDRIRGGARLSAIYKVGSPFVCLITGGPAKAVPKLVQLEGKPTDVAVLDTSLVAVFSDGRAALYDSEAIAAASDAGPITARHTTALGVRGEPRAILLTGKGGPTLWIGTSTGEVLSAALVRKSAV